MTVVLFVAGLLLLVAGAEVLVRGASRLAVLLGITPLVVGLTVVAFGTSAPELAVSILSSVSGRGELAVGNVVGSNIFNILLILGASAVAAPLIVTSRLVRFDIPLVIAASGVVWILALDGTIGRIEGALLFGGILVYTIFAILEGRTETAEAEEEAPGIPTAPGGVTLQLVLVAAGLGMLVLGSNWLVTGASELAARLGVSETVIGLTVVAGGTSLPEAATSIVAALRGARDVAVGNVVGSNLFNLLAVLGAAGLAAPGGLPVPTGVIRFDMAVMTAAAVACLPVFFTGHRIDRWEGALFLGYYLVYTAWIVLAALSHPSLITFSRVILFFALPLTAITLGVISLRALRARRGGT